VARETIGSVKSQKKKKWIFDASYAAIREKREAKGKDKKRYQELKAEVQRKLRVDKQRQLEGMCMELEAAKVRPWCGQPSDRGRLKNRTEQNSPYIIFFSLTASVTSSFHHHVSLRLRGPSDIPHMSCAVSIIKPFICCQ